VLFLHGVEGKDYVRAEFHRLDRGGFEATVLTEPTSRAVREIKGVTYHDLAVETSDGVWHARVIFDV
jgi:SHS2 domain-containing protein